MHQASKIIRLFPRPWWLALLLCAAGAGAAEHRGRVVFNGSGVPGAVVTASQGSLKEVTVTDMEGGYLFADLADGMWNIRIEMLAFAPLQREVTVGTEAAAETWELQVLPVDQIPGLQVQAPSAPAPAPAAAEAKTGKKVGAPAPTNTETPFQRADVNATGAVLPPQADVQAETLGGGSPEDLSRRAADGFLISGTANNSASSPFSLSQAFGNARLGRSRYNGNAGFILGHSALDARPYSLTGMNTEKPDYSRVQGSFSLGGPLYFPGLVRNGPNFNIGYQFTRSRNIQTLTGLVPTAEERAGDLSHAPGQIIDPATGLPFEGNRIPFSRISPQAQSLMDLYPLPNFAGSTRYNYQVPVVGSTRQDGIQGNVNKLFSLTNQLYGAFSIQSSRGENPTLLGFTSTNRSLGGNAAAGWRRSFTQRFSSTFGLQFSRQSLRTESFFQNRKNISGLAGITGNNQEPLNWGPPALHFMSGLSSLSDAVPGSTRNQSMAATVSSFWSRGLHTLSFGGEYRRQQVNILSQQNPRGSFTFTGASTLGTPDGIPLPGARNDFAAFLLGIPDTVSIAFGNADKYFRYSSYQAYIADDWHASPNLTLNFGLRWEYASPVVERYGRLVNLDVASGFSAVEPVIGNRPAGPLTGADYPDSLIEPDRRAFQPRVGFAWRPMAASSIVVRGGYGIYYNSSPYLSIAMRMAQQSPLSRSLSLQNTPANPLTLAHGFDASPNTTANTFAVDPNLRIGYLHIWQLSIQRDLPFSLQLTAAYQGTRGRRALQQFLPNTYPAGAVHPCPSCPAGFIYLTSNGTSSREAGTLQIRRRLRSGFTASVEYTYAKSIDDAAPGGTQTSAVFTAQDWLNPGAERALSAFDQRHKVNIQFQYTSGMGIMGGALMRGWRGALFKEWTVAGQINAGSGLPLTPVFPAAVSGTGVTGPIRPDRTAEDIGAAPHGLHLNPAAYKAPAAGRWGNAGRNTITGPGQFSLDASLARNFQVDDRMSLEVRVDASNALNHVTYPSWNTTVGSSQFGLPLSANPMRSMQMTARLRF